MFCTKCGNTLADKNNFCSKCGEAVVGEQINSSLKLDTSSGLTKVFIQSNAFDRLIGKNIEYYRGSFLRLADLILRRDEINQNAPYKERIKNKEYKELLSAIKNSSGFNWSAGIFSFCWFAYRKMYAVAIIIFIAEILLAFFMGDSLRSGLIFTVVGTFVVGRYANQIYFEHLNKKVKNATDDIALINLGGTSFPTMVAFIFLSIIFNVAIQGLFARLPNIANLAGVEQKESYPAPEKSSSQPMLKADDVYCEQNSCFKKYNGKFFSIYYPQSFALISPANTSTRSDFAVFQSQDRDVDFYIYSPQWSGSPPEISLNSSLEKQVGIKKSKGKSSNIEGQYTWCTIEANDKSYSRSYQTFNSDDGSISWTIGIKYKSAEALNRYKSEYAYFKKSLEQFADGGQ